MGSQGIGSQGLLVLIGLQTLVMMNSLQNIVISGAQDLMMLMNQMFDEDDQATKHEDKKNNVSRPDHLYQIY